MGRHRKLDASFKAKVAISTLKPLRVLAMIGIGAVLTVLFYFIGIPQKITGVLTGGILFFVWIWLGGKWFYGLHIFIPDLSLHIHWYILSGISYNSPVNNLHIRKQTTTFALQLKSNVQQIL